MSNSSSFPTIGQAFTGRKALIGFLTAGDPDMGSSGSFILEMERAGIDLIEIGIPFSDPVAEGEVIQQSDFRALKAGATIDGIFDMVDSVRQRSAIPMVFLTYINPLFVYGYERFLEKCAAVGIAGLVIPDLPFEEREEISVLAAVRGIEVITLISPVSRDRVEMLSKNAAGFVYLVSSLGVTGVRSGFERDLAPIVEQIRKHTKTPVAIGFGISTPEQAREMAQNADGVIVGSAIVKIIAEHGTKAAPVLFEYISQLRGEIDRKE
ncbi:MAG: tryptophan synthase subunit alpha [Saccharofermentanales bacterium]